MDVVAAMDIKNGGAGVAVVVDGGAGVAVVVDGEDESLCKIVLPSWPSGQKSAEDDLKRDASALELSVTLMTTMAGTQNALAKEGRELAPEEGGHNCHLHRPHQIGYRGPKDERHEQVTYGGEPDHVRQLKHYGSWPKSMICSRRNELSCGQLDT
jgi:hypothetical protein